MLALEIYDYLFFLRRNSGLWLLVLLSLLLGQLRFCSLDSWHEALLKRVHQRDSSSAWTSPPLGVRLLLLHATKAVQVPGVQGLRWLLELVIELELVWISRSNTDLLLSEFRLLFLHDRLRCLDIGCWSLW